MVRLRRSACDADRRRSETADRARAPRSRDRLARMRRLGIERRFRRQRSAARRRICRRQSLAGVSLDRGARPEARAALESRGARGAARACGARGACAAAPAAPMLGERIALADQPRQFGQRIAAIGASAALARARRYGSFDRYDRNVLSSAILIRFRLLASTLGRSRNRTIVDRAFRAPTSSEINASPQAPRRRAAPARTRER